MSISDSTANKFNINTEDNCSICLEHFSADRDALVRAACGHVFHENCFIQWRQTPKEGDYARQEKTCSLCRGPLDTAQYIKPSPEDAENGSSKIVPYVVVPGAIPSVPAEEGEEAQLDADPEETERLLRFLATAALLFRPRREVENEERRQRNHFIERALVISAVIFCGVITGLRFIQRA